MKILKTLILFLFSLSFANAQLTNVNELLFRGQINFLELDDMTPEIKVSVSQDGVEIGSVTSTDGNYILQAKLDLEKPFHIYFTHKSYMEKYVTFDFTNMLDEAVELDPLFEPFADLNMDMLRLIHVDLKSLCVAKFFYSKGKVKLDQQFSIDQREKIENALKI